MKYHFGGCTRIRTLDPLIKSQLLYQLSYTPKPPLRITIAQSKSSTNKTVFLLICKAP